MDVHQVETDPEVAVFGMAVRKPGGMQDAAALDGVQRVLQAFYGQGVPLLHFDEHHRVVLEGHEIHLAVP